MRVLATAGHVDHGKSTLVLALTGTDPDRLAEEKARGLTIDLGFAVCTLPDGEEIAFVDVPGHVRFIKNMLAGVGAVDACLFVVAATEGWKPQSEEHLRILSLLGIRHGVIALTKADLVDKDWLELVTLDIGERVAGTFLADAPIVPVDGVSARGLPALVAAMHDLVGRVAPAVDGGRARLWIDRSFPVRGAGTVVTGTLTGGVMAVDDVVSIAPGGLAARVRALHTHHVSVTTAQPGRRLAVNLAGVAHSAVARGQAIVHPGQWHDASIVDASLTVLAGLSHPVGRRGAYAAYIGSGEFPARVRVIGRGGAAIGAGGSGFVRLWLPVPLPLQPGDRYVLREAGRSETVGGGEILDVAPIMPASRATPSRSVERIVAERGWVPVDELARLAGLPAPPTATVGRWVVDPVALAGARDALGEQAKVGVDLAALDERARAVLAVGVDGVVVSGGRLGTSAAGLSADATALLSRLDAAGWSPPDVTAAERGAARELARSGLAVDAGGVWFATSAVSSAGAVMAGLLASSPEGVTVGQVRDALGSSRKHVVPLLGWLDAAGVTRRRGDLRIAGPRLPPV